MSGNGNSRVSSTESMDPKGSDERSIVNIADVRALGQEAAERLVAAKTQEALRFEAARWLGGDGRLRRLFERMKQIEPAERKAFGQAINGAKKAIEAAVAEAESRLRRDSLARELAVAPLDITLPGRCGAPGTFHPVLATGRELIELFRSLGFEAVSGPQVDTYGHNFTFLGFPKDHPATDMQDSFFVAGGGAGDARLLLRTHTSNVQVQEMHRREPPMAVVSAGAVFRRDDDITHSPMFYQLEGFHIAKGISFAHLRGTLTRFVQALFGADRAVRLRPSYFPFVEPGAELDISCPFCEPNRSCRVCKDSGWVEVLGCGMIHPNVFEPAGIDYERYSGFAFGLGVDRLAMLRYGVRDIRWLYANDPAFLSNFPAYVAGGA